MNVSCRLLQSVLPTEDDYNVFTTITPGKKKKNMIMSAACRVPHTTTPE